MKANIVVQNNQLSPITLSIGMAEAPRNGETVSEILRAADSALYSAKEEGGNRIVNFNSDSQSSINTYWTPSS